MDKNLILKQMEIGPLQNFLYIVGDRQTKEIAVVDPAWDVPYLAKQAKGYTVTSVFLTHCHSDHVNGLSQFLSLFDVPVYMSKHEADYYKPKHKNLIEIDDKANVKVGNIHFKVLHTPGHSPGCQCFLYEDALITGDTIFIDGCGRCDLPGSDPRKQYHSLHNVIMKLPDSTVLYSGHNYGPAPCATLGEQKKTNPYLTCNSMEEFLQERMGISF